MNFEEIKNEFKKLVNLLNSNTAIIEEEYNCKNMINFYSYENSLDEISFSVYENIFTKDIDVYYNVEDLQDAMYDFLYENPTDEEIEDIISTIKSTINSIDYYKNKEK